MNEHTEKLMLKHLEESNNRDAKVTKLEVNQKHILRVLAKGDNHFQQLFNMTAEIKDNVAHLTHIIKGNGQPGIWEQLNIHTKQLTDITDNCAKTSSIRSEKIKVIEDIQEKQINKFDKYVSIIDKIIGAITLVKIVGTAVILYIITNLIPYIHIILNWIQKIIITYFGG